MAIVWRLEDDCLAPEARLRIDYTGPNPFKAYQIARKLLMKVLNVGATRLWERDFRWDITSDPRSFFCRIYVDKGIDARSRAFIEVTIQGLQPSDPTKDGKVTIYIGGRLITLWTLESAFQRLPIYRGIIWVYHKLFYNDVRRGYLKKCVGWIEDVWRVFRDTLSIPTA